MRSAFIAGFVKQCQELNTPDTEIMGLWKAAMDYPESAEMVEKLANDLNDPVSIHELEAYEAFQKQAAFEAEIQEIEDKLK